MNLESSASYSPAEVLKARKTILKYKLDHGTSAQNLFCGISSLGLRTIHGLVPDFASVLISYHVLLIHSTPASWPFLNNTKPAPIPGPLSLLFPQPGPTVGLPYSSFHSNCKCFLFTDTYTVCPIEIGQFLSLSFSLSCFIFLIVFTTS